MLSKYYNQKLIHKVLLIRLKVKLKERKWSSKSKMKKVENMHLFQEYENSFVPFFQKVKQSMPEQTKQTKNKKQNS